MLEQVELKIQELKKLQAEEYYKKKDADLRAWELTEKTENGKTAPIIVTDEEYEALIKASSGISSINSRNGVAKFLEGVALACLALGIIVGFALMAFAKSLGFVYFSVSLLVCFLMYAIFKGLSEAIKLLQQILDQRTREKPSEQAAAAVSPKPQAQPQYQQYVQQQPQTQYQVTYTTAAPPSYVQVTPPQYQPYVQAPVQYPPQQPQYQQPQYQQPPRPQQ